jgi:hypothetical protein
MPTKQKQFAVCVRNKRYEVSLEPRKIYEVVPDADAAKHSQIRVVDESGDDYLFPESFFAPLDLSPTLRKALLAATK